MAAILERYGLDKLSDVERRAVMNALKGSLPEAEPDDEWEDWEIDLIRERIAASDANPNGGILLSDLKRQMSAANGMLRSREERP